MKTLLHAVAGLIAYTWAFIITILAGALPIAVGIIVAVKYLNG